MALEYMNVEMLKELRKRLVSDEIIDKYEIAWASAIKNSGLPIPCPCCFIDGNISRLNPLKDEGGISAARCINCKTKFEWSSPE